MKRPSIQNSAPKKTIHLNIDVAAIITAVAVLVAAIAQLFR